jgi:hypothetical protein
MAASADEYLKRVLEPARKQALDLDHFDYFARYDLDPGESSEAAIEEATKKVRGYWNRIKTNPQYRDLVNRLLKEHKKATDTLLNEERRNAYAARIRDERQRQRKAREQELDRLIADFVVQGYITPEQREAIIKKFPEMDAKTISARIPVPVQEQKPAVVIAEGLPSTIRAEIRTRLQVFKHPTLYHFLGVSPFAAPDELAQAYHRGVAEWSTRPPDPTTGAANTLLGLVRTHLLPPGGREKYEQSRQYEALERVRESVRLAALSGTITAHWFDHLVQETMYAGLDRARATDVVRELARQYHASVEVPAGQAVVTCLNCYTSNPLTPDQPRCRRCGAALFVVCPRCGKEQQADAEACASCGFRLVQLPHVRYLFSMARIALDEGDLDAATRSTAEIRRIWGSKGGVAEIEHQIAQAEAQRSAQSRELDALLRDHRYWSARDLLSRMHRQWTGYLHHGQSLDTLLTVVNTMIQQAEEVVRQGNLSRARGNTEEAARHYEQALSEVADYHAALSGLHSCHPSAPSNLLTTVYGRRVVLTWERSPSHGAISYRVVRKVGAPIADADDGTVVAERVSGLQCEDRTPEIGKSLFYAVFALRRDTISLTGVCTEPLFIAAPVSSLELYTDGTTVYGSWILPVPYAHVRVTRLQKGEGGRPASRHSIPVLDGRSFQDDQVVPNQTCTYEVRCRYDDPLLGVQESEVVREQVTVVEPPEAISDLTTQTDEQGVLLRWTPPARGQVLIYRLPPERMGEVPGGGTLCRASDVRSWGTPLLPRRSGMVVDDRPLPLNGRVYYVPVTRIASSAMVGRRASFVYIPDVQEVTAEDRGDYVEVRWRSDHTPIVQVAWSSREPPSSDANTHRSQVVYGQCPTGYRITDYDGSPLHIAVFAGMGEHGSYVWSRATTAGSRTTLPGRTSLRVRYSIDLKRVFFGPTRLYLRVEHLAGAGVIPELKLIGRPGNRMPLRVTDGDSVLVIPQGVPFPFEAELDVPLAGLPTPAMLRLYAADRQPPLEIEHPPPETLKLK